MVGTEKKKEFVMKLRDYTIENVARTDEDVVDGTIVDMVFFKITKNPGKTPDKEVFEKLAREEFPHWFDGHEHSYLETGGDVGDQEQAMAIMALGKLLGVWNLLTPAALDIPKALQERMAGMGMISIIFKED